MSRRNPQTIQEKAGNITIDKSWLYYILLGATIISFFFFSDEKIITPKWATLLFFLFLLFTAIDQSWEAWKRKGAIINTTLGKGRGGSSGFNPDGDYRIAKSHDGKPNFAVIATGGFNYWGFSMQGNENFIVCPPEHVMQWYSNFIIKTRLRRVWFEQLPNHIQNELLQLPRFKKRESDVKRNLWFGMTSAYYGTDTDDNLRMEEKILSKMDLSNEYSHIIEDLIDQRQKTSKKNDFEVIELNDSHKES